MITDFNIRYKELSLTGNIPECPKYTYEYNVPDDVEEILELAHYLSGCNIPFVTYTNNKGEKCLACDITPVVLKYRPQSEDRCLG